MCTCIHEGHSKVYSRLSDGCHRHINTRQVSHLRPQLTNHTGPLAVLEATVGVGRLQLELVLEFNFFGQGLNL